MTAHTLGSLSTTRMNRSSKSLKPHAVFFNMWGMKPHLIRYWLHSSEKVDSPETFAEKVLEHKYPDKPDSFYSVLEDGFPVFGMPA